MYFHESGISSPRRFKTEKYAAKEGGKNGVGASLNSIFPTEKRLRC